MSDPSASQPSGWKASSGENGITLLLGRRDEPTDGIENDSKCLASVLRERGLTVGLLRFAWKERGLLGAARELRSDLKREPAGWVILQYTPLSWGPKAFPLGATLAARVARAGGSRFAVDIHDVLPTVGPRLYDRIREKVQVMALRGLVHRSDRVFVHVDPVHVEWADPADRNRMTILPTGTAIPPVAAGSPDAPRTGFTIVVFGLSDMHEAADAEALVQVVERAADRIPGIRLHLVGRGADVGGPDVRRRLAEHSVDVEFEGVVPEPRVSEVLSGGDVFLFLRSGVSSRRSTVVAALAHGLPIVGYQGAETGWPVTEAGLALADHGDDAGVAQLLVELAEDQEKRSELAARSRQAFDKYFSWSRIADVLQGSLQSTNGREGSR